DLTDDDVPGEPSGANNFLRFGRPAEGVVGDNTSFESLWRDSFNWSGRLVVTASNETIVSVDVEDDRTPVPGDFLLSQNYPNPFNPTTSIAFNVPQAMDVTLKVYDLMGREVATLVDGQLAANRYTVDFRAENLPSGTYVYRLVAGTNVEVRKMTLVK
ncbi:MAG: T9SS type A sorting domain-containing protein, partial [Bacteroidota bacterium]